MADNWLASFAVALGFDVNTASLNTAKKSIADYEKAVKDAEARIDAARWAGARSEEERNKLVLDMNLKEARAALASAQEREKSEKETARKREERHKEFVAGLNKAAIAAAAAATAITYAVNKVTSAFDNLGFVSQRTGASVQGLNSLSYAFKQTGGSAQQAIGMVERFAQAVRGNDGLKTMLKNLGVDMTQSTENQALSAIEIFSKHPYQVGSREAGLFGISEEDYKLITDHLQQIRDYREEYNRTTRALGVDSQSATEASQSFWRSLTKLQATASALSDKLMVSLAPALEAIVKRFNEWIASNPQKIEEIMRSLSESLSRITDWLSDEQNQKSLEEFWTNFLKQTQQTIKDLKDLLEMLIKIGKFVGLGHSSASDPTGMGHVVSNLTGNSEAGGGGSWLRRGYNAVRRGLGFGGDEAPIPSGTARVGREAQSRNAQTIIGELRRAGYNNNAISAIVASMQTESGLNPAVPQNSYNRGHTGLWQWDRTRWAKIAKWITDRNGNPMDAAWQTRAWIAEHNAKPGDEIYDGAQTQRGGAMLRNNPSIDQAIHGVRASERFGPGEEGGRAAKARGWLPHVSGTATPAPAASPPRTFNPGAFDPNNIDPKNLMPPAPVPGTTTNNSSVSKPVTQHISMTTHITGTDRPKEAAKVMETAFGRMHGLALANAQSAVV